jgi:hypothetical protein
MDSKLDNDPSTWLRGVKVASGGIITEIFVMVYKGLNVGQTNPTGDFMQGDEAKWQETYLVANDAVFVDTAEEEDGINLSQASLTISRNNGSRPGAVTIEIDVNALD